MIKWQKVTITIHKTTNKVTDTYQQTILLVFYPTSRCKTTKKKFQNNSTAQNIVMKFELLQHFSIVQSQQPRKEEIKTLFIRVSKTVRDYNCFSLLLLSMTALENSRYLVKQSTTKPIANWSLTSSTRFTVYLFFEGTFLHKLWCCVSGVV